MDLLLRLPRARRSAMSSSRQPHSCFPPKRMEPPALYTTVNGSHVLSAYPVPVQCSCKLSPLWVNLHTETEQVQGSMEPRVRIKRHGRGQGHGILGGAHKGWLCTWYHVNVYP